jgi:alpha-ketoglutarate-dependent taurine dioxygenase
MTLQFTPLDSSFGARVTGGHIADFTEDEWTEVIDAFHNYAALVFSDQHLTPEQHVAFGKRFGDIEYLRPGEPYVAISNLAADGQIMTPKEKRYQTLRGNEGWHTDSTYMPVSAKASALAAEVVPTEGGETELADMRAAYEALDADSQAQIADLAAYHSLYQSQAKAGFVFKTGEAYGYHTDGAPLRPLVKVHPVTGRKALFIGRHAYQIPGMSQSDAAELLDTLLAHACQAPRTYLHKWQPGDIMIWDNRCVLHRACPYDYNQPRVMRHVRIAGSPESECGIGAIADNRADGFTPATANASAGD